VGNPRLKKSLKHVKLLATWKLVLILVLMLFIAATLLRLSNIGMVSRRDAVIAADKAGDKQQLADRLSELKQYVFSHMNASTDFYLNYQYQRDAKAAITAASQANSANPNGNVNEKAAQVCDALARQFGWGYSTPYFNCFVNELAKYPGSNTLEVKAKLPSTALYYISFVSPLWTPSLAGLAVLICLLLMLVIVVRITIYIFLRLLLLRQPKD